MSISSGGLGTVTSVTGTSNQIASTGGATPVLSLTSPLVFPGGIRTATNCSNAASPAVCGSATAGVVAVPTGATPTLTINTTAVTANSQILLQIDESATIAATTCNTTLATLVQPVVTARVAATSFTIQINATLTVNPACVSFFVIN